MKILSFDIESNGLHGEAFAVAGVVLDSSTLGFDGIFRGATHIREAVDPWVEANVPIAEIVSESLIFDTARLMRDAFWGWLQEYRQDAIVLLDFGIPVESKFLIQCVMDDTSGRAWQLPYPCHELGTILLCAGVDPDISRLEYAGELKRRIPFELKKHEPFADAIAAALCAVKAMYSIHHPSARWQPTSPTAEGSGQ